jgi:signal transduction histidine kinase
LGDIPLWGTFPNYHLSSFIWGLMDYINIVFYLLALYFILVLLNNGKDIKDWQKIGLFALTFPAWWITVTGQSIVDFFQPWCEATNNDFLTHYKLGVEMLVVGLIMLVAALALINGDKRRRKQISIVSLALVLFLTVFASAEYIASTTAVYEFHLYSLFVLPVFLAMIIYAITNLKVFAFRTFGTQLLVGVLLIMVGSQFFFLQDTTDQALTIITFGLSSFLAITLLRNVKREDEARQHIERLAGELKLANEGQSQLIHFINHQIKGYLSKARMIFAELLTDSDYGPMSEPAKKMLETGKSSLKEGVDFVQQILRASNIDKGTFAYEMNEINFKDIVHDVAEEMKGVAEGRGLEYKVEIADGEYKMNGDQNQLREAIKNFIDNSIRYTPAGTITVKLSREGDKARFVVEDTGIGLSDEVKPKLFTRGGKSKESLKVNINSTGYGLAIVRSITDAHHGRVWAESEGEGKGSTFYMELPLV